MKTNQKISILLILITYFGLSAFENKKYRTTVINLKDAIKSKVIQVEFRSTGNYQGASIVAKITNTRGKPIKLIIPAGSYFDAQTEKEQDLVLAKDVIVQLAPKASSSKVLNGFCCKASNRCPIKGNNFRLSDKKLDKFDLLTTFLKGKKFAKNDLQDAVWCISDRRAISNVSGKNCKELREKLASITGLKNDWYSSPQSRTVDRFGNINRETVAIHGDVKFQCPANALVHQEIRDISGKVLVKGSSNTALNKGTINYIFNVSVKGWKKGEYTVALVNRSQVLVSSKFKV